VYTAALSLVGGLAEAAVLVLVVNAAVSLSQRGSHAAALSVGPLQLSGVAVGVLLLVGVGVTIVRLAVQLWASWLSASVVAEIQRQIRVSTLDAYVDATWAVQATEREGSLQQQLTLELQRASDAVSFLTTGLTAGCNLVMLLISAIVISPVAAMAMLVLVTALFFALRPLAARARAMSSTRSLEELGIAEALNELVRTAEETRVHGVGDAQKSRFRAETDKVARWVRRIVFVGLSVAQAYQGFALLVLLLALYVVYQSGATNLAGLGAVVLVLLRSFAYTQQLQNSYHQIVANAPSIEAIRRQQEAYRRQTSPSGSRRLDGIDSYALESVSYSYVPERPALDQVGFSAVRGEVIGVIGPSGAGKSTLVQILLRLRAPDRGRYLIDGVDAGEFCDADWANLVSYVPQEPKLIAATVAENIRFFRDRFGASEVEAAARLANIHDEICAWPEGYATRIGQRADAVSGGQRQRLCIARALLSSPGLLILDEPTSALDAVSEQVIQRTLEGLRGRCSIVIVAHRLSTLSLCDRILVLSGGRVEALDTPQKLAEQAGFYQRVVDIIGAPRMTA
jgi:ABC-type multidrug transport system fused ATPase/permease subunit